MLGAPYLAPTIGAISKSVFTPAYRAVLRTLRSVRDEAGLSQRDLAARLGVPPSWVAKVELGERRIDVVEFIGMAEAMGRDPRLMFGDVVKAASRKSG